MMLTLRHWVYRYFLQPQEADISAQKSLSVHGVCALFVRLLTLALLLLTSNLASAIAPDKLNLNRPVIDQAHLLNTQEVAALENNLRAWNEQNLMQAAVVIVPSTDGMDIFDYTLAIFNRWQLGTKKADNGLLFVIAQAERKFFIQTGRGLEGALPDVSIVRIERTQLIPNFKRGQYYQGINSTLDAIATQLSADEESKARIIEADKRGTQTNDDLSEGKILPFLIPLILLGSFIRAIFGRFLGAILTGVGGAFVMFALGAGLPLSIIMGFIAAIIVLIMNSGGGGGRPPIIISGGGFSGGGFGGGGFGGYGGGGGGTAGGGAGGSW